MAYNPYAISGSILQGLQTEAAKKTRGEKADIAAASQKQEMVTEFEDELEAKEKAAQAALRRKYKSKGGWLGSLGSIALALAGLPIAAAGIGGASAAIEGKRAGKHALSMAELAKKHATDIDPRWKGTFLGRDASKYLRGAEKGYGDIVRSAEDMKSETGSLGGMLKTGMMSGLTSYAMGKAFQGIGDKFKAVKGVKELKGGLPSDVAGADIGELMKSDFFDTTLDKHWLDTESMLNPEVQKTLSKLNPDQLESLSNLSKLKGVDIAKLFDTKMPGLKAIFSGVGDAGKGFGTGGDYATTLAGLLAMLQGTQQGIYK